jgi:hypothetical protein
LGDERFAGPGLQGAEDKTKKKDQSGEGEETKSYDPARAHQKACPMLT